MDVSELDFALDPDYNENGFCKVRTRGGFNLKVTWVVFLPEKAMEYGGVLGCKDTSCANRAVCRCFVHALILRDLRPC